jgi:hypothetical protein
MGWSKDVPADYLLARASRYWGVPPWEMEEQSIYWRNLALACESAEHEAEAEALKVRPRR